MIFEWTEERPWGRFKVLLDSEHTKVKLIEVDPGHRTSLQSHKHRTEHWTWIVGDGEVDDGSGKPFDLSKERSCVIDQKVPHRVKNTGDVPFQFIEIQTGTYFGEDDIIRHEDDYERPTTKFDPSVLEEIREAQKLASEKFWERSTKIPEPKKSHLHQVEDDREMK